MALPKTKDLELAQQMLRNLKRRYQRARLGPRFARDTVCKYWLKGKCSRNPCNFMHGDQQEQQEMALRHPLPGSKPVRQSNTSKITKPVQPEALAATKPEIEEIAKAAEPKALAARKAESEEPRLKRTKALASIEAEAGEICKLVQPNVPARIADQSFETKQCKYWVTNNCVLGEKCHDIHSWFSGSGIQLLTKLEGHNKAVTGIALPSRSDKLYSGGEDRSIRVWDCNTGKCVRTFDTNADVGCLMAKATWLFVGLTNIVKGWDCNNTEFNLNASAGLVHSIDVDDDNVCAGMEDGTIFLWKRTEEKVIPEPVVVLKQHTGAVSSVLVGGGCMFYSGSNDGTIKRWNRQNMQCVQTLYGHTAEVTSLYCWDKFLLSASLDKTIKVWAGGENGEVELVYEKKEDDGVLVLCGMLDSEDRPVLLCSCLDNTVRLYDIPSFNERGRIFSKREVRTIRTGTGRLFFYRRCVWRDYRLALAMSYGRINGGAQVKKGSTRLQGRRKYLQPCCLC